jgi:hypothetical protein
VSKFDDQITVLIPTSPIPSHDNAANRTEMIDKTLKSIRFHLPDSKIIIMVDDIRPQIEFRRSNYEAYKTELRQKCERGEYGNVEFIEFDTYSQQARMTRAALEKVTTPFVLFVEHDTPFITDANPRDGSQETLPCDLVIHWEYMIRILHCGVANQIRFCFWQTLPTHYWYHMMGYVSNSFYGPGSHPSSMFLKTNQYSQWPNLATKDFYKRILTDHFHARTISMIEIPMATLVAKAPWEKYKVLLYYPEGNARRFGHLEGRIDPHSGQKDAIDW